MKPQKKKVLLVTDDDAAGGTAAVSRLIATELAEEFDLTLLYNQNPLAVHYFSSIPSTVAQLNSGISHKDNWRSAFDRRSAEIILDRNPSDLIVFSDCMVVGSHLALKEAAEARNIPFIMIVNGVPRHSREELGYLVDKAIRATNKADSVVLVSHANLRALESIYPEIHTRRLVIPNSCDRSFFQTIDKQSARKTIRNALGLSDDQIVLFTAGRLQKAKGQHLLLSALGRLAKQDGLSRNRLVYVIAGKPDPEYDKLFMRQVDEENLSGRVLHLGFRTDVHDLLLASDIYALTSYNEGAPISIIEAMATGLPIIATSIDGIPEQVDSFCAWLAPDPKSSEEQCILELMNILKQICREPLMLHEKGISARTRANQMFHPSIKSKRYSDLIASVTSQARLSVSDNSTTRKLSYALSPGDLLDMKSPERCWNYLRPGWSRNRSIGVLQLRPIAGILLPISPLLRSVALRLNVNFISEPEISFHHLLLQINGKKLVDAVIPKAGPYSFAFEVDLTGTGPKLAIEMAPKVKLKNNGENGSEMKFMPGSLALESIRVQ